MLKEKQQKKRHGRQYLREQRAPQRHPARLDARTARVRPVRHEGHGEDSGGASAAAQDKLEKALDNNPAIKVQDKKDISNEIAQMFTLMLNMLYGLLAMAVIRVVLGVINTLAMSSSNAPRRSACSGRSAWTARASSGWSV
ncbi:hypothetical protein SPURM210S_02928 [Streptomyces purpurascens]